MWGEEVKWGFKRGFKVGFIVRFIFISLFCFEGAYANPLVYNEKIPFDIGYFFQKTPKIQVYRNQDKVYLIGSDEPAKKERLQALANWAGESLPSDINYALDINITNLIRQKLDSYMPNLQVPGFTHSLNCHGTTLILQNYLKVKRFVSTEEMNFYLTNYCREVPALEPGAVVVSYLGKKPFHSYTLISENLAIEKKSVDVKDLVGLVQVVRLDPQMHYYRCNQKINTQCDRLDTFQLEAAIDAIERAVYEIGNYGRNLASREDILRRARTLQANMQSLNLAPSLCVQKLGVRLESLVQFLESIQGAAIFRKTDALIFRESPL